MRLSLAADCLDTSEGRLSRNREADFGSISIACPALLAPVYPCGNFVGACYVRQRTDCGLRRRYTGYASPEQPSSLQQQYIRWRRKFAPNHSRQCPLTFLAALIGVPNEHDIEHRPLSFTSCRHLDSGNAAPSQLHRCDLSDHHRSAWTVRRGKRALKLTAASITRRDRG